MRRGALIGIIAGGVVLVLLWYFVLFSPTSSKLSDTRGQVATMKSQNQELQNTIRRLKELSANATQQAATLRTLRAAIPPNPDLGAFILQANDIAAASGIDWLSIAPSPPAASTGGGPSSTITISMQVNGGFFQVLDYLNRLEGLERLVIVDSIHVSAGGSSAGGTGTGTSGSSTGSSSATSSDQTSTSSGGAPDLSVTLTGRMFTTAQAPAASGSSSTGSFAPSTPGGSTTTTPSSGGSSSSSTTPPASSSGSSS